MVTDHHDTCAVCCGAGWMSGYEECPRCGGTGVRYVYGGPVEAPWPRERIDATVRAVLSELLRVRRATAVYEAETIGRALGCHGELRADPTRLVRAVTGLDEASAARVAEQWRSA